MEIEIERLAFGGAGIGRLGGKVVFVKGGLPGEVLQVNITKEKKGYAEAQIHKILKPSLERINPPCPVFSRCGGCQWQHLKYSSQLRAKENILRETLERIGGLKGIEVEPIVSSPKEYGYRNRVTLSTWLENGNCKIGYYEERSHERVAIERCPVAADKINEAVFNFSESLTSVNGSHQALETVYISSDENTAHVTLVQSSQESPEKRGSLVGRLIRSAGMEGAPILEEDENEFELTLSGLKFRSTPSVFVQANDEINERLIEAVVNWSEFSGGEKVLDLYSGIGNFSLHLAKTAKEVVGVEINKKAVRLARKSAKMNSINNVFFKALPCELFIEQSLKRGDKFDLVVLDPPREGAKTILNKLAELAPEKIIYVSCDPPTLARDLKKLTELGYRILKILPFDMFPQTYHIESAALLSKA